MGDGTIIGVFKDFRLNSLNMEITPMQVALQELPVNQSTFISCRLNGGRRSETMKALRQLWEKHYLCNY